MAAITSRLGHLAPKLEQAAVKPRVVVIGCGWGGLECIQRLDTNLFETTVISTRDHMCFTPLLAGAATGALSLPAVAQPIRESLVQRGGKFHLARADFINTQKQTITVQPVLPKRTIGSHFGGRSRFRPMTAADNFPAYEVPYDFLVMAPGVVPHSFGIEGVEEYCYTLKYVTDALRVRSKIIALFDRAAHPHVNEETKRQLLSFVVCGAGPTGVEFTAELLDLVNRCAKQNFRELQQYVSVTLIEGRKVLSSFSGDLADYTMNQLESRNVEILLGDKVIKVTDTEILLESGRNIAYGFCLWSAGNRPVQLIEQSELKKSRGGKVVVNECLQVHDHKNIFVIGDSAEIEGLPLPPTAQVATQQGKYVAQRLNESAHNQYQPTPWDRFSTFRWTNKGQMAFVGEKLAVLETPGKHKPLSLKGLAPWFVWKGFYWSRQFSARNRVIIATDWLRTALFGRTMMRW